MFTILTHVNQSTLLSFSLFQSFVTNSTVAEEALSAFTDVSLILITAWYSFSSISDVFEASNGLISFFTIYDWVSFCVGIVLSSSLSWITWILCFDFKWWIQLTVLETHPFV